MLGDEREKYVVYESNDGHPEAEKAWEDETYDKKEIKLFTFIWHCLFERGFFRRMGYAIKYALRHSECWKGDGASDLILLKNTKGFYKIWRSEK